MFSSEPNYTKLKTNLKLAINRLKLLEKKKTELALKSRKEIADYIGQGKFERAKIRVEQIIREDYLVEGLELVEMYCDILLSRFGLMQQGKTVDPSLAEAISSLIWATPRIESDVSELKVISDQFAAKFGKKYVESCHAEAVETISEKLKHKLGVQPPPKILVEKYLVEIAKNYNMAYEPDPQVMREAEHNKGIDTLLFDGIPNNLGSDAIVRPTGFVDYPNSDPPPEYKAFNYPPPHSTGSIHTVILPPPNANIPPPAFSNLQSPPACPLPPGSTDSSSSYSFNIPLNNEKPSNALTSKPNEVKPNNKDNFINAQPKPPVPNQSTTNVNIPELPSVPSDIPSGPYNPPSINFEDIDFDDLTRRFEELKKKK